MNKKFKLFAILSVALILSVCLVFAACNNVVDTLNNTDNNDANVDKTENGTEVAKSDSKVVSSLAFSDKEEYDVKDGVLQLTEKDFEKDGDQLIISEVLEVGDVVLLDYDAAQDEAYRVANYAGTKGNKFVYDVVVNDDVYLVYDNIDVSKSIALTDDGATITFLEDSEIIAQVMDTELIWNIEGLFDTKPSVSIPVKEINKENEEAHIKLEITIPIYNANNVNSQVKITLDNYIYIDSDCNFNLAPLKFDLGAYMTVKTYTTFTLGAGYGISGQEDAETVVSKLLELCGKDPGELNLTIFSWSYPVGPLLISYDLDIKFNVQFSGEFNMTAESQVQCYLGTSYDKETAATNDEKAFDVVFEKGEDNYFKLNSASLYGKLNASVGIVNTLRLDILAVAGVGLKIDLGLYADLYGAVDFNIEDVKQSNGGYYFEPGFYYDLDLLAGLNVANIIKLNKNFDLVDGRIAFPHLIAGEKTFIVAINNAPETVYIENNYVLPTLETKLFNLINANYETNTVDYNGLEITLADNSNLVYSNGVLTVKDTAAEQFEEVVTIALKDAPQIIKSITFVKESNRPYAKAPVVDYTKGSGADVEFELELKGATITAIDGIANEAAYEIKNDKVVIDNIYLSTLENERYTFVIKSVRDAEEFDIEVWVNVLGKVSLFANGDGTEVSPYLIYSADQLIEMTNTKTLIANNYFNGMYFKVVYDIDFEGKEIKSIPNFAGVLYADEAKTLSNYVIKTTVDGYTGFFAKNSGTVKNLVFDGVVDINEQIVYAGAVAGLNNGTIEGVATLGKVTVSFATKYNVNNKFYVGGVVGWNKGTVKNATSDAEVSAYTEGTQRGQNVTFIAGIVGYNEGTATDGIGSNSNVKYTEPLSWYVDRNKVTSNDSVNNIG